MNGQTGFLLELDGFCDTLKLAFEFGGIQHMNIQNISPNIQAINESIMFQGGKWRNFFLF